MVLSLSELGKATTLPLDRIALTVETPLRLIRDSRVIRNLTFPIMARSLMRRASSMAYYYGGAEPDADFKWLAQQSDLVATSHDRLQWVEGGRGAAGLAGEIAFTGALGDFHPFLLAGERLHLGKDASFGFGRIRLARDTAACNLHDCG